MSKQATRKLHDDAETDLVLVEEAVIDENATVSPVQPPATRRAWDSDEVRVLTPRNNSELHATADETARKPLGQRLREAREEIGLSIKEVADRLYLESKVIEALEADDYTQMPAPIFVQGYIRGYARLLDLPVENLLKLYHQQHPSKHPQLSATSTPGHAAQTGSSHDAWYKVLTFLIIVGLMVLVAIWRQSSDSSKGSEVPLTPMAPPGDQAPLDTLSESPPPQGTEIPLNLQPGASGPAVAEFTPPAEGEQVPAEVEPTPPVEPPPPPDPNSFKLSLSKDSWIEVTDAKNAKLYKRTARAGENLSLAGTPPFKFIVRHVDAVTLEYQNNVIDLSAYKGNRSARFTLSPEGIQ